MAGKTRSSSNKQQDDLSSLLGSLDLKDNRHSIDDKSLKLQKEINRAGFRLFECISDNGYFSWNPPRDAPYKTLSDISKSDQLMISSYLDVEGKPDSLVDPSSIRLPKAFLSLDPHEHKNQFPYGKNDIVCLHVAAQFRGIDFKDIDFVFGGSTLEMLATHDASDPYMVTLLPDTSTILVSKNKDYVKNLSDVGFQFERLMEDQWVMLHPITHVLSIYMS